MQGVDHALDLDNAADQIELVRLLSTRTYAYVRLPDELGESIDQLQLDALFDGLADAGPGPHVTGERYCGYEHVAGIKEVLFVKWDMASAEIVPQLPVSLVASQSAMSRLALAWSTFSRSCFACIGSVLIQPDDVWASYVEPLPGLGERGRSADELCMFRYALQSHAEPCALHTDYSLLTLIPCAASPGLVVLNLTTLDRDSVERAPWLAADGGAQRGRTAVVFGGEALERISNGRIQAAMHGVEQCEGAPRLSAPFLLHARPEAPLPGSEASTMRAHLDFLRSQRASVNYD